MMRTMLTGKIGHINNLCNVAITLDNSSFEPAQNTVIKGYEWDNKVFLNTRRKL